MKIQTVIEKKRGCGYREPGGLYLRTDGIGRLCGALPIELVVCPTCHQGIKPARGWTWINIAELVAVRGCHFGESLDHPDYTGGSEVTSGCGDCPIADAKIQTAGLIWVGEKFYPTIGFFQAESAQMGISRRIAMIPQKFKLGETWVALAHRRAIVPDPKDYLLPITPDDFKPGIFHIFKPSRIEYVVKDDDQEDKLDRLEKRGITLVRVLREQIEMEVVT